MSAFVDLINYLSLALALVFSFSSFVLAAISIRWGHTVYADYFKVDPATITAGVLATLWTLSIIILSRTRSTYTRTKTVLAVASFFAAFYLGIAISYSALRTHGIYDCSNATNTPTGNIFRACGGLNKALQAITWINFIFFLSYIVSLYLLAKKHSSLHWTKDNGLNVPVGLLNPVEPKEEQHAPKH